MWAPDDLDAFRNRKAEKRGIGASLSEILHDIAHMPKTMRQLAPVQLLTWLGLFCMWLYFPVAVAHNVFGASDTTSSVYTAGIEWGGICFGVYSAVCFAYSFVLPALARAIGRKNTHTMSLACGALGLISVAFIHDKYLLLFTMVGVGIAWASTLSMPYSVLAGSLPPGKTGIYMGIFNFFIVMPEIIASLFFGWVMNHLLSNNRLTAVVAGGCFMLIAALLMQRVLDPGEEKIKVEGKQEALQPVAVK
jgi:maltose/moltooligosaccharide transporter